MNKKNIHIDSIIKKFDQIPTSSPKSQKLRISQSEKDIEYFMKTYLPHYITEKTPSFHRELFSILQSKHRFIAIAAPRGFSKSTIISFCYVLWSILFEKYYFIVIISASDTLAEDISNFIRMELLDNTKIIEDFGIKIKPKGSSGNFIAHKTRILARGKKQIVRGFRHRQNRPDLIIIDDIEKDEEALSQKIVEKSLHIIQRGLIPSLKPNGSIIAVGTILQKNSTFGTIMMSNEKPWNLWHRKIYQALTLHNGEEHSIWEERFSTQFLKMQRKIMGKNSFNAEYQNIPSDDSTKFFKESWMKKCPLSNIDYGVIFIDPSVDGVKNGDFKAGILVFKSEEYFQIGNAVLIQGSDGEFFEQICNLYNKFSSKIVCIGIESNGFQQYFIKELERYAHSKNIILPIKPIKNHLKKEYRIQKLGNLFERGSIIFHPDFWETKNSNILIDQLLQFPNGNHDDAPDALSGAIDLLSLHSSEKQEKNFIPLRQSRFYLR